MVWGANCKERWASSSAMPSRMWAGGAAALSPIRACANSFMDVFSRVFEHGNKLGVFGARVSAFRSAGSSGGTSSVTCCNLYVLPTYLGRGIEVKVYTRHSRQCQFRNHGQFQPS